MNRLLSHLVACMVALALLAAPAQAEKLKVVASFSILGDMVEQVTGDLASVTTIVGPDADAHVYTPNVNDARAVTEADVIFVNGLGFETWSKTLIDTSGTKAKVFIATEGMTLIDGIHFKRDGIEQIAKGRVFVIAAHAIETPKLLLMSRTGKFPNGMANCSDQVGRNLMDHPTHISLCLARDPVYPFRGPTEISGVEHMRDGSFRNPSAAFRMPIGNNGWSFGAGLPTKLVKNDIQDGYRGEKLRERLRARSIRQVRLAALIEQLPDANNRISLSEQTDGLGLPRPRIEYAYDDYVLRGQAEARKLARLAFDALGATYQRHLSDLYGAGHIIGTCRMGNDPRTSVADPDGRTHDHPKSPELFPCWKQSIPDLGDSEPDTHHRRART